MTDASNGSAPFQPLRKVLAICEDGDDDRGLIVAASELAARNGAALRLLSVIEPPADAHELVRGAGLNLDAILKRLANERKEVIGTLARDALSTQEPEIAVRIGKPFIEIVRDVVAEDVDMVVKIAEPLRGARRFLFASTDQHLLRKCPCSVWLRRPDSKTLPQQIVAAVDVDLEDAAEPQTLADLNLRVMDVAAQIAARDSASVLALHAWDAPGEGLVRTWSGGPDPSIAAEAYVTTVHSERTQSLRALVAQASQRAKQGGCAGPEAQPVLERGPARTVIPEQCEKLEPDVLVIGTVARTGLRGVIIGNSAEDVLNSIECSVVAVKPPGFVTPLDLEGYAAP
jgi:universal stress protein E